MTPTGDFLSPADLAALLAVPLRTVREWRTQGTGPPAAKIGKHVRYRRRDVDEWIKGRTS